MTKEYNGKTYYWRVWAWFSNGESYLMGEHVSENLADTLISKIEKANWFTTFRGQHLNMNQAVRIAKISPEKQIERCKQGELVFGNLL